MLTYSRDDTKTTFDVIVGTPPFHHCFKIHKITFVRRSRFFRAARKPTWLTGVSIIPVNLTSEDPDVFLAYFNIIYRGAHTPKECGNDLAREFQRREKLEAAHYIRVKCPNLKNGSSVRDEWFVVKFGVFGEMTAMHVTKGDWFVEAIISYKSAESGAKAIASLHHQMDDGRDLTVEISLNPEAPARQRLLVELADQGYEELIKLWLLVDKLQDLEAVNMVVDELFHFRELVAKFNPGGRTKINPGSGPTAIAYASTAKGSLLRKLLCQFWVTADRPIRETDYPAEFLADVALEKLGASGHTRSDGSFVPRQYSRCDFHQHDEEYLECSGNVVNGNKRHIRR